MISSLRVSQRDWHTALALELLDYRLFTHLSQTMHFGRTARALGLSASALTRRVQAMEEEVGQPLLIRDHREVRMTTAGLRFRAFAQSQLEQWDQLLDGLRDEASAPTGILKLACTVTAAHTVLPHLITKFRTLYPGVTLGLITQDATRSLNQLEGGEVDLAVIPTDAEAPSGLSRIVLGRTEFAFIGPRDLGAWGKALSKKSPEWADIPFVAPLGGLERKRLGEWCKANRVELLIGAEVRGNEGIIAMVRLGGGIGLVPRLVLESSPLRDHVQVLEGIRPPPGYDVSLCTRPRNLGRRVIQLFWELAQEGV